MQISLSWNYPENSTVIKNTVSVLRAARANEIDPAIQNQSCEDNDSCGPDYECVSGECVKSDIVIYEKTIPISQQSLYLTDDINNTNTNYEYVDIKAGDKLTYSVTGFDADGESTSVITQSKTLDVVSTTSDPRSESNAFITPKKALQSPLVRFSKLTDGVPSDVEGVIRPIGSEDQGDPIQTGFTFAQTVPDKENYSSLNSVFDSLESRTEPLSVDGYYPLYKTVEAANEASYQNDPVNGGTSTAYNLGEYTFYMPDGLRLGVDKFEGTYSPAANTANSQANISSNTIQTTRNWGSYILENTTAPSVADSTPAPIRALTFGNIRQEIGPETGTGVYIQPGLPAQAIVVGGDILQANEVADYLGVPPLETAITEDMTSIAHNQNTANINANTDQPSADSADDRPLIGGY